MKQSLSEKNGQIINPSQSMGNSEHRPILIVFAGPNGSGKTSVTSRPAEHTLSIDDAVEDLTQICLQKGGRIA